MANDLAVERSVLKKKCTQALSRGKEKAIVTVVCFHTVDKTNSERFSGVSADYS